MSLTAYDIKRRRLLLKRGWSVKLSNKERETSWGDLYLNVVKPRLNGNEVVLDIGTAEGNRFSRIARYICYGVGIDKNRAFIRLAKKNHRKEKNLEFIVADSMRLPFGSGQFDIVTSRHAPVKMREVYRVLRPGGIFVTQQVLDGDKINLKMIFGRGQGYNDHKNALLLRYRREMAACGFTKIRYKISNVPYYFKSKKKLIDFLYKTPTIPHFSLNRDRELVDEFVARYKSAKGIKSNSRRFLLEGVKP
jgi:SAM-dependent methyltransferase